MDRNASLSFKVCC